MTTIRVASFNIYFFGEHPPNRVVRDDGDLALLARVIAATDADVIAFQEIHDTSLLQAVLNQASSHHGSRSWSVSMNGTVLASGPHSSSKFQVALGIDTQRVAVKDVSTPIPNEPNSRKPLVVGLSVANEQLQAIVVHMKSGLLDEPANGDDSVTRAHECLSLRDWILAHPIDRRLIIGDFNAFGSHPSVQQLRSMPGWTWPAHRWPVGVRRWTTHLDSFAFDPCAIDHLGLAPGLTTQHLEVNTFDQSDEIARDSQSWKEWLASDQPNAPRLQRVSDHRPVFADLEVT